MALDRDGYETVKINHRTGHIKPIYGTGRAVVDYYQVAIDQLEHVRGKEDLERILKRCKNKELWPPVGANPRLSTQQWSKILLLCESLIGYNYAYHNVESLMALWGCNRRNMNTYLKHLTDKGIICLVGDKRGEYFIEVNPFYGWRAFSDYGRVKLIKAWGYYEQT